MVWKLLSSKQVYKNRFMCVTEDVLLTDDSDKLTFGIVHKEAAVWIIPWDGERMTIVGQYRYPVDTFSWEFPAGHMEHAGIEEAAQAELEEETGLVAKDITKIGTFFVAPGHNTQIGHVYLATGLSEDTQKLETAEKGMQVKTVTREELSGMVLRGEVQDGPTITSLKFFELYQSKNT